MKKLISFLFVICLFAVIGVLSASAVSNGDTIEFGAYPQSQVTDSKTLSALNAKSVTWKNYSFYINSEKTDSCAKYAVVTLNGEKYRAVKFSSYRPCSTSDGSSVLTSYQAFNGYKTGTVYWFKYEPVSWKVLDKNNGTVITEDVIDAQPYLNVVYENDDMPYANSKCTVSANNFSSSYVEYWLNNSFYELAFSDEEEKNINGDVCLMKKAQVGSLISASDCVAQATDYAKCLGAFVSDNGSTWWTDSTDCDNIYAVNALGKVTSTEWTANLTGVGVRPVINMKAFTCSHSSVKSTVTKATVTSNGKTVNTCSLCGKKLSTTTINKVSNVSISASSFVCTGSVRKPTVTVKDSSGTKLSTSCYTLTWSDSSSKAIGKYTVTVKLKGNYSGSKTFTYKIKPGQVKNLVVSKTSTTGKVNVNFDKVEGGVTYIVYYSTTSSTSGFKKLAETSKITNTVSGMNANITYYFKVKAYKKVSGVTYYGQVSDVKSTSYSDNGTAIKNGTLYKENGVYYIKDKSTGVKFILVNKTYSLPSTYVPSGLTTTYASRGLTSDCSAAFGKLIAAAKKDGVNIFSVSGYRSYSYQKSIYNNYVSSNGQTSADTFSARPGHSEHQTGLAIDCNSLKNSFKNTTEGKWLAANCYKYGFIIRYGATKQSSTGYVYEPWHIRYLGSVELATKLTNSGLSIEEYYGITSKY